MKSQKKISVIIRCKNEEHWIGHCIQSVIEFLNKPEIIIIDNKSTDETISIVRSFIEDPKLKNNDCSKYTTIKILKIDNYSPGKSINLGIKNASNSIVLVISAHCVIKKINLSKHIKDLHLFYGRAEVLTRQLYCPTIQFPKIHLQHQHVLLQYYL